MLIHLKQHEIDLSKWNDCIEQSQYPTIYAQYWYLSIVSYKWNALIWVDENQYSTVLPIPIRNNWNIVQQPLFCQFLGIFSRQVVTTHTYFLFINELIRRYPYISAYHFNPSNYETLKTILPYHPYLSYKSLFTQKAPTPSPELSKDLKKQLKRASKNNWDIRVSTNIESLITLFDNHHARLFKTGIDKKTYPILRQIWSVLLDNKKGEIWLAYLDNQIQAGILFVENSGLKESIYLFNAATDIGRTKGARAIMLSKYLNTSLNSTHFFDFESPEKESIQKFYANFGVQNYPFISIRFNGLPWPLRPLQNWRVTRANQKNFNSSFKPV